jgi:hypothetical protein
MKKLIVSLLVALSILWAILYAIFYLLYQVEQKKVTLKTTWAQNLDYTGYDIVYIGPSLTWMGINPNVVQNKIGLKGVNLGFAAYTHKDCYAISAMMIHNKTFKPKVAVLNVCPLTLTESDDLSVPFFMPYISKYTEIYTIYKQEYPSIAPLVSPFPIIPYIQFNNRTSIIDRTKRFLPQLTDKDLKYDANYGFLSIDSNFEYVNTGKKDMSYVKKEDMQNALGYVRKTIAMLQSKNIRVFIVSTPYVEELSATAPDSIINCVQGYMAAENVPYFNFIRDSALPNHDYFINRTHLNAKGARVVSSQLADSIDYYIKKK